MLKLDFEKVYDRVDWACVTGILRQRGFGSRWIHWINVWPYSTKVCVLINGKSRKVIVCKRGLRQGDPLSSLLFVLVVEGLNMLFRRMEAVRTYNMLMTS